MGVWRFRRFRVRCVRQLPTGSMVLLDKAELPGIFATIKASAAENVDTPTVLLLVSHSIDSLAACTILTRLLEDELVSHKVVPVMDYAELSRVYREQIVDASELRSIFLINCGGIIDLMGHLQLALDEDEDGEAGRQAAELPHPDCKWYVLDSHRPYALENVGDEQNVSIIHDGEPNEDLDDIIEQLHILYEASDGEDSDDDEDDWEPPSQRRRVTHSEYGSMSPDSQRDRRKFVKKLLRRYYSSSWHGTASSVLCYSLVQSLNKASNELLWLAIIGLTDQLVHERVEYEKYVGEAQILQAEVGALNQDGGDETREVASGEEGGPSVTVKQHISSRMRIDSVQELRLSLMRHWTVYEALQHSPYIASRLGLYQQAGREKLDIWLARMGIPLEECKQEYQYMRKQFKAPLFEKMLQYGNEFGLVHLTYPSFRCVTSYGNTQLAAADLVSGVAAVLENYDSVSPDAFAGGAFAAARSALLSATRDGIDRALKDGMQQALERAKEMLRATVAVGHSVLVGHEYTNFGDFHSVKLKTGGDSVRFTHPLALTKLALYISDALREGIASLRNAPSKPLLIAAPNPEASPPTYLIVAVLGSARSWRSGGRNGFGNAFARAADKTNAHIAHDGFDSAACKVAAADYDRFHEHVVLELGKF